MQNFTTTATHWNALTSAEDIAHHLCQDGNITDYTILDNDDVRIERQDGDTLTFTTEVDTFTIERQDEDEQEWLVIAGWSYTTADGITDGGTFQPTPGDGMVMDLTPMLDTLTNWAAGGTD